MSYSPFSLEFKPVGKTQTTLKVASRASDQTQTNLRTCKAELPAGKYRWNDVGYHEQTARMYILIGPVSTSDPQPVRHIRLNQRWINIFFHRTFDSYIERYD